MNKIFFLLTMLLASCTYHVRELEGEFNPTGSTTVELFQYAVTIGVIILILWLIGQRNMRKKNN